jgi:hypothetical protein
MVTEKLEGSLPGARENSKKITIGIVKCGRIGIVEQG